MVLPVGLFLFSGTIKYAQRVFRLSFLKRQSQGSILGVYDFCWAVAIRQPKIIKAVKSIGYLVINDFFVTAKYGHLTAVF